MKLLRSFFSLLGITLLLAGCSSSTPDTTSPTVTISQPRNNTTLNSNQVAIQGSAQDNTQVARITYQLNGGQEQQVPITPGQNVSFQFQVTLQQGQNTIAVHAYDQANNKGSATIQITYDPTAVHTLSGAVVSEYAGGPVAGSTLKLYKNGNLVGTTLSGADGSFSFGTLAPGTYRLEAQKPGMAGSVLEGIRVPEMASVTLIQRQAFDANASTTPPTLLITQDGTQPLEGGTFTNAIPFRVQVDTSKDYVRPMRLIYVALGRTPGATFITNSATWTRQAFSNVEDTGNRTLSGANVAGFGSTSGEAVYVEVVAYDFNLNRSHYLIPITFKNTSPNQNNTVSAPTGVAATAITLGEAVGFYSVKSPTTLKVPVAKGMMGELTLDPQAAPEGSNLYVEVRWCYTATAVPFAFDIERSTDGTNWNRVGTVGGARSSSCDTNNPLNRPFFFRDASPDLTPGQTYYYRVVARGANQAPSAPSATTPLPPFFAPLLSPADESVGVSRTPDFVIGHPQLTIGADGAAYNLVLWDTLTGDSVAWQSLAGYNLLVEFGTPDNGIPSGEALVYGFHPPSNRVVFFTDTAGIIDPARPNRVPVDTTQGTVSIPYNFDGLAQLPALQALRSYAWQLFVAYAYKHNPQENRISAYSIQTWPSSTSFIRITRPGTQVFDFTTGQ
ncbi:carboxypeptidase regulatory-like domain-containing protein [Meiothermus sp. QL-1]|uniref:carboxypeptidase regulatory-like domain-containing protein n=1 Tax=Meiothermus sp. QL-1 TaxID=2058095 RepID=UPI000E0A2D6F|nr:carboxypeptidase regulatory-like domain-containing protein [Meiothermus sp. QL-1]RDI95175.1 carboxypeptidase regulatory-like domain-containing protein [Meiothermus sp. QL-1]